MKSLENVVVAMVATFGLCLMVAPGAVAVTGSIIEVCNGIFVAGVVVIDATVAGVCIEAVASVMALVLTVFEDCARQLPASTDAPSITEFRILLVRIV